MRTIDVIFDIDGTIANASHRLHYIIPDPNAVYEQPFRKDWDAFLSDEAVAGDAPIEQTFHLLTSMLERPQDYRVIFITGRPEAQRQVTYDWLRGGPTCPVRRYSWNAWERQSEIQGKTCGPIIYMRSDDDRRLSHIVKGELLDRARMDGFDPKLVFEDRKDDTAMWRSKGLLCCQVAEGDY